VAGGFVKLYGTLLLGSSLMDEALEARWLFICFLAEADETGFVRCQTVGNAARLANLTHDQAKAALEVLSSPDPKSTSPEDEGRRIVPAPGGWRVVNYGKYREMRTERQVKKTQRQRRWREHRASTVDAVDAVRSEVSASLSVSVNPLEGGMGGERKLPGNPLLAGKRPDLEREGYALIRKINEHEPDRDPWDILIEASGWETKDGKVRSKLRLETMTDDHLIRTVKDLRSILALLEGKDGQAARR
jgi:hypothetical protein